MIRHVTFAPSVTIHIIGIYDEAERVAAEQKAAEQEAADHERAERARAVKDAAFLNWVRSLNAHSAAAELAAAELAAAEAWERAKADTDAQVAQHREGRLRSEANEQKTKAQTKANALVREAQRRQAIKDRIARNKVQVEAAVALALASKEDRPTFDEQIEELTGRCDIIEDR